jgi:hypothetical protein
MRKHLVAVLATLWSTGMASDLETLEGRQFVNRGREGRGLVSSIAARRERGDERSILVLRNSPCRLDSATLCTACLSRTLVGLACPVRVTWLFFAPP